MRRRDFLARAAAGAAALAIAERAVAQQVDTSRAPGAAVGQSGNSNLFAMDQDAAKTVRRPPKAGARKSMSDDERDAVERQIRCQCGCTLDVYICRTTDFSCQVSPAMHRDVISLVEGGYSAQEIIDAFAQTYGERALMAPTREGFNLAAYFLPFVALGVGAVALVGFLRRMQARSLATRAPLRSAPVAAGATADEMAQLERAIREDA